MLPIAEARISKSECRIKSEGRNVGHRGIFDRLRPFGHSILRHSFAIRISTFVILLTVLPYCRTAPAAEFRSHPPTRPLPTANHRPLSSGPNYFVDGQRGSDANPGSEARPWRSIQHGVNQLRPGDTLVLHGGVYYEHVQLSRRGSSDRWITIRSYPGELVVLDGGLREFFQSHATAWRPASDGVDGEYVSTSSYPDLGGDNQHTNLLGNFGDSLVPLHGYRFRGDLQSDNPYWNISSKTSESGQVYCGPGIWYDVNTGLIHARLAHTKLPGLGADNYRGETDPRKLPLIIAGHRGGPVLSLRGSNRVRLEDLVLRGAREATLEIRDSSNIELSGLSIYGGSAPIAVRDTQRLLMEHTACRGLAAPWTFRGSLKYRAIESRLFSASGWEPTGNDSESLTMVHCEFTDSVDGVFIGNVRGVRFAYNLVDNVSDDGIFLTAATAYDGTTHGGDVQLYRNRLSRCLTTFAFGVGHGRQRTIARGKQTGSGIFIYRNVFDFRRPVMYHWPTGPEEPQEITSVGRVASDHGGPAWEPMWIYHNTMLAGGPPRYDYGTDGLVHGMGHGTSRRVFNNIVCTISGMPGQTLPPTTTDFQADGNLFWSVADGPSYSGQWLAKFQRSPALAESQRNYPPGWTAHDQFANPLFENLVLDGKQGCDLRLRAGSPAINSGVALPTAWPDDLNAADAGRPDRGAIPAGSELWPIGIRGRLNVGGETASAVEPNLAETKRVDVQDPPPARMRLRRAAIVTGYPAFDAPLVEFSLRRQRVPVERFERAWLEPAEYSHYGLVVVDGSFARAKVEPGKYSLDDLPRVRAFLERGGTLLLMRERWDLFATPHGQLFLGELVGTAPKEATPKFKVSAANHRWIDHLSESTSYSWLNSKAVSPLRASRGEALLASDGGSTILHRLPVGQGALVYVGWSPAAAIPHGRLPSSLEDEASFDQQMQILLKMVADLNRPPAEEK
jgi:hypothetical protein